MIGTQSPLLSARCDTGVTVSHPQHRPTRCISLTRTSLQSAGLFANAERAPAATGNSSRIARPGQVRNRHVLVRDGGRPVIGIPSASP